MTADLETMFRSLQTSLAAHRPSVAHAEDSGDGQTLVPVTIVTGFLGAGKTTLLAALLQNPPVGCTVRAVVNDVGELGLDPSLLVDGAALDVELSNGCGCCAVNDDLASALDRMARLSPDLLVLEASGVTDPFAVAQIIEASPVLTLDRTVAVVDALMVADLLSDHSSHSPLGPIVERQLDAADAVVLSRTDLVATDDLADLLATLAGRVPGRTITPSSLAKPASTVLHPGAVRGAALPPTSGPVDHDSSTDHLIALTFDQRTTIAANLVTEALAALPRSILRCKGILHTDDGPVIIQSTPSGHTIASTQTDEPPGRITIVATDHDSAHHLANTLSCERSTNPAQPFWRLSS